MIIPDSETLRYLQHRVGEKQINSRSEIKRKALEGNVDAKNFLKTFGNTNITAYVGFIDLAEFSTIVQGKTPEEISSYLRPFLEKTINILYNRHSLIDKMIGDEIMFILPETEESNNPPEIFLLGQIMGALYDLAYELRPNYRYRIGLSYGKVKVFHLKGKGYSEWSIVGEPVHVAKRLHGLKELKFPNPICGAFGLASDGHSIKTLTALMKQKIEIFAGPASRFSHKLMPKPKKLKGVGKVLWAYLYPKGKTDS